MRISVFDVAISGSTLRVRRFAGAMPIAGSPDLPAIGTPARAGLRASGGPGYKGRKPGTMPRPSGDPGPREETHP